MFMFLLCSLNTWFSMAHCIILGMSTLLTEGRKCLTYILYSQNVSSVIEGLTAQMPKDKILDHIGYLGHTKLIQEMERQTWIGKNVHRFIVWLAKCLSLISLKVFFQVAGFCLILKKIKKLFKGTLVCTSRSREVLVAR